MATQSSASFERLHPLVRQWIWQRNWTELRDAQEEAIRLILDSTGDVIISAATASGKTEAAFFPIASSLLQKNGEGLVLYISPLKALINDQCLRLDDLFGHCGLPVHPWHGDVAASKKSGFDKNPRGVLLITPESLESIFVRRGFYAASIFRLLSFVVVDELHSFINTERGYQLCSLLCRMETILNRRIPRIGLSATLGDLGLAAEFLRPGEAEMVKRIESTATGQEIRLQIKGYTEPIWRPGEEQSEDDEEPEGITAGAIGRDLFKAFRGSKNLAFANSRRRVEDVTDRLVRHCEDTSMPVEFFAHHGSLSKNLREDVEGILKEQNRPASAVCTSTLEMGIDIGQVKSVAQLDPPFSIASLRQRLGRSGRRGEAAILRMFIADRELNLDLSPEDTLRLGLFQAIAITTLLLAKGCEPPSRKRLHLSTLIQQVLSLIAQYGGLTAREAWRITCKDGPFRNVDPAMFGCILRGLAEHNILMQSADGTLLHAPVGERIVNHYSFYTAFMTPEEFKIIHNTTVLGTLPVSQPILEKSLIVFGGRRWRVMKFDESAKIIEVVPAQGGKAPKFAGGAGRVHKMIHKEMFRHYRSNDTFGFLDAGAQALAVEGREQFARHELAKRRLLSWNGATLIFLWAGDLAANTLLIQLQSMGLSGESFGVGLRMEGVAQDALRPRLEALIEAGPPDPITLAGTVLNRNIDRYDEFLPPGLLSENYASAELDCQDAWQALREALQ